MVDASEGVWSSVTMVTTRRDPSSPPIGHDEHREIVETCTARETGNHSLY